MYFTRNIRVVFHKKSIYIISFIILPVISFSNHYVGVL